MRFDNEIEFSEEGKAMVGFCNACKRTHEINEGEVCQWAADAAVIERVNQRAVTDPPPGTIGHLELYGRLD